MLYSISLSADFIWTLSVKVKYLVILLESIYKCSCWIESGIKNLTILSVYTVYALE